MPGAAGLLLILSALLGDDGRRMPDGLHPSPWLASRSASLWIVFHQQESWQMAFALDARAATNSQHGCACDGLLPALERSRLFLFAPYYRNSEGRVREGGELAVDVAEHLFKAQLLFVLEGEVESKSKYARWAAKRANLLFDEVAPELRQGAYLEAVSDFGAHRLAMANEMRRLMRRAEARGEDPCRLLAPSVPLARLWHGSFGHEGYYPGGYWQEPATPDSAGSWRRTRRTLMGSDKRSFLRQIL